MSDIISADFDKFEEAISSISNIITDIEGIRAKINQADESLRDVWTGKSSDAYFENSEIIKNSFNEYVNGLHELLDNLNSVKSTFLEADYSGTNSILKE
ncbi:Hypothetical protein CM240_1136 [Clostridium bornimense]|uniref:ESAT-6-like protein n=1 Tax=Clostridium bornimense TaxID=1216932 RepID=W6SF15_9CLOT|nr:WXG100 family type VII secretion target [Clostridium bornimense]CDM68300.1 Hypothetical protein CM240_1136 [Clostridium bornimense]